MLEVRRQEFICANETSEKTQNCVISNFSVQFSSCTLNSLITLTVEMLHSYAVIKELSLLCVCFVFQSAGKFFGRVDAPVMNTLIRSEDENSGAGVYNK